jgi:hypothetical protein
MNVMEDQIKMAAKLYRCRDTAKGILKEDYHNRIADYKAVINQWNKTHDTDTLESVITICAMPDLNGVTIMMFMAAAVEIIEPS